MLLCSCDTADVLPITRLVDRRLLVCEVGRLVGSPRLASPRLSSPRLDTPTLQLQFSSNPCMPAFFTSLCASVPPDVGCWSGQSRHTFELRKVAASGFARLRSVTTPSSHCLHMVFCCLHMVFCCLYMVFCCFVFSTWCFVGLLSPHGLLLV